MATTLLQHWIELKYRVMFFIQRGRRGWCDEDTWAIDFWLLRNLIPMLERLRIDPIGPPMNMYRKKDGVDKNGYPTINADRLAEQRWYNLLGEILYGLKCAKKIQDERLLDKELMKRLTDSYQRSFKLIGKYLFSMWD